jgi:hypothetical protein
MASVVVSGALANKYRNGGGTWERMSWVVGLRRLGFEVCFVEQISSRACVDATGAATPFTNSVNLDWFRSVTEWFGVADRAALVYAGGAECAGLPWTRLLEIAESADLLVNLSGHLTLAPLTERIRRKAYIDVDPGFTQFWHADPETPFQLGGHDFYFTIGETVGEPGSLIPDVGLRWHHTPPPVSLVAWPVAPAPSDAPFNTVSHWYAQEWMMGADGIWYSNDKRSGYLPFLDLPRKRA